MASSPFQGFRSGSRATAVPNEFFTTILPAITEPAELVVSAYLFFALGRLHGPARMTSFRALVAERPLLQALSRLSSEPESALRTALSLAVSRGTLLAAKGRATGDTIYLLNSDLARRQLADGSLATGVELELDDADPPRSPLPAPSIYALYEENIGSLPPLLIDELDEASQNFPAAWVEAAFREAVANNRRSWRYIQRILQRWSIEGPDYETPGRRSSFNPADRRRTIGGPYRRVIEPRGPDRR